MKVGRPNLITEVLSALQRSRAVGLVGPRQCGKSTLARQIGGLTAEVEYFDLEDPEAEARLRDAKLTLAPLKGLVIIDEVQRRPDLMPLLRVLLDRDPLPARYLLLGSASPELIRGASESLAGRIEFIEMEGFTLQEVGTESIQKLWLRGGFPLSYLARSDADSFRWRSAFLQAFFERDLRLMGVDLPPLTVLRFITMLAHYHGQTCNGSEIARSMQLAHTTIKRYLDILTGALLVYQLPPWAENIGKRLVKSPKIYIRDSGLLHALLDLPDMRTLQSHPKLGASWEGFAMGQLLSRLEKRYVHFWSTHGGAELDLCVMRGSRRTGVEFKYSSAPTISKSMRIALEDLRLDHLYIVTPGDKSFALAEDISVLGLSRLDEALFA
jgi:predicted AAA+ superfamily ATPase